jgi:hypothetical protein
VATKKAGQGQAAGRQRQAGRKKSEEAQDEGRAEMRVSATPAAPQGKQKGKQKKVRPVRCIYRHADVELRRAFPEICKALIDKAAKTGSVQHFQALEKLGGKAKAAKGQKQGPSLGELLMAELKRRQDEREQAMDGGPGAAKPESAEPETTAKGATSGDAEEQ